VSHRAPVGREQLGGQGSIKNYKGVEKNGRATLAGRSKQLLGDQKKGRVTPLFFPRFQGFKERLRLIGQQPEIVWGGGPQRGGVKSEREILNTKKEKHGLVWGDFAVFFSGKE